MTTREFIKKALTGETRKDSCSSVMQRKDNDGNVTVYSYGYHYPLVKIINGKAFVNDRGYSVTTAKHIGWAFSAAAEIVGWENVYHAPLNNRYDHHTLTPEGIKAGATEELLRLHKEMATKKRKDTQVYAHLEYQKARMVATLEAVA